MLLGLLRQSKHALVRVAATCWVEFFRGVSTVVQLFWLYFALPFFGISLSAETAAIIGLGLVHGAYGSEVVRGAMQSISRDQWEAATALGYSRRQTLSGIIMPQALIAMLPPLGNSLVLLLKEPRSLRSSPYRSSPSSPHSSSIARWRSVPIFICVLLIYYSIAIAATWIVRFLEHKLGRWRPQTLNIR